MSLHFKNYVYFYDIFNLFFLIGPRFDGYSNYSSTIKNINIYLLQSIQLKLYEIIKTVQLSFEQ